jgi:hypothetical protein
VTLPSDRLLSRRRLLQAGGIGAANVAWPGLVSARMDADQPVGHAARKSCIFVWLCGGPSHLDTWDLKPEAPAEIRGPYRPIATSVPGLRLSELHTRLAPLARHFSVIRSMMHVGNISNHFDAMHHCLSGQAGAPDDAPYIGSVLSRVNPSPRNFASYFWLLNPGRASVFISAFLGTGGYLGARHAPLRRCGEQSSGHAGFSRPQRAVRPDRPRDDGGSPAVAGPAECDEKVRRRHSPPARLGRFAPARL